MILSRFFKPITYCTLLFAGLLFVASACKTTDTCNRVLGTTFQSVLADTAVLENNGNLTLLFDWSTLTLLPDTYFSTASLLRSEQSPFNEEWINNHEQLDDWTADKTQLSLELNATIVPSIGATQLVSLHYRFPDRQEHIDCIHPGSGDSYYFDLTFTINRLDTTGFSITDVDWKETFSPGGR